MLLPQQVDVLLGLHVNIFEQLPQLGHLGLALSVDVELGLGPDVGLGQPLRERDDLQLQVVLLALDPLAQVLLRAQVLLQNVDAFLQTAECDVALKGIKD